VSWLRHHHVVIWLAGSIVVAALQAAGVFHV